MPLKVSLKKFTQLRYTYLLNKIYFTKCLIFLTNNITKAILLKANIIHTGLVCYDTFHC